MTIRLLVILALALPVGCGSGTAQSACTQAFVAAQSVTGGGLGVDALDPAIQVCATVDDWTAAWSTYPSTHGSAVDPIIFLKGRCLEGALTGTPLCQAAAAL